MVTEQKWERLTAMLRDLHSAVLAYSGGVDSSLVLRAAAEVMGPNLIAVTAESATYPPEELAAAAEFARSLGVTHRTVHTSELLSEKFVQNSTERCYFCKHELFNRLKQIADAEGLRYILDGSNVDDLRDHRPGRRAAGEFSVRSPLVEAGLSKADIREIARGMNLCMWDKPSLACLSSRIPYGTRITRELLHTIHTAEDCLRALGIRHMRVRHQGNTARIEIDPADFSRLIAVDAARTIVSECKRLGYTYVCLDLEGYRTGSMNEGITTAATVPGQGSGERVISKLSSGSVL